MNIDNTLFRSFVTDIKEKILSSQYQALKAVNKELIALYWDIGKTIVQRQENFGWGKSIVKNLSDELQKEFVGLKGFSERNLWNMRNYYTEYRKNQKLQTLSTEIGWSHNVLIFQKCKDDIQKETTQPIVVATYKTTDTLPVELQEYLPSTQDINEKIMKYFDENIQIEDSK
jgi:predicted nuclease of restriction endonuclease-like (RecB) superfamily